MAGWKEIKESVETSAATMQKWGGLASFLLTVTVIVPPWIYLVGDLRAAIGPFAYALADFLFGPVCAASLVMALMQNVTGGVMVKAAVPNPAAGTFQITLNKAPLSPATATVAWFVVN